MGNNVIFPPDSICRLQKKDFQIAVEVLTEAFLNDPFFKYIMNGDNGSGKLHYFHQFIVSYGMKYGNVFVSGDHIEGTAVWLPPGKTGIGAFKSLMAGVLILRRLFPRKISERFKFFRRLLLYGNYSNEVHKRNAPFPHWYLMAVGVRDGYRKKGYASRLIKPVLDYFDRIGIACYLETHNENNVAIYEHFGFRLAETGRLPGTDKPHFAMLRDRTAGSIVKKGAKIISS